VRNGTPKRPRRRDIAAAKVRRPRAGPADREIGTFPDGPVEKLNSVLTATEKSI